MNVSSIKDCYGCGVCTMACNKKIIDIRLNDDGFYEPFISNINNCTNCGLCIEVCAYSHEKLSLEKPQNLSYAAWSNDSVIRHKCSSGGISFEIGKTLIEQGYKVCGVKYSIENNRAEHYIASTTYELFPSIGSKYIQSYTVDGFKAIKRNERYLITGTPCQIDSFRRYIQKFKKEENFILMDFFCHGVPSMLLWQKYLLWVESKTGKINHVSWRNKFNGWCDSYAMAIKGEKGCLKSRLSQGDMFYKLFLSDTCLGKACYTKCKYKYNKSAADIRIGDLWGQVYEDNQEGVSAVIAITEKGNAVLKQCNITLEEHDFEIVAEGQMKKMPPIMKSHIRIIQSLKNKGHAITVTYAELNKIKKREGFKRKLKHPFKTLKNIIRKLWR